MCRKHKASAVLTFPKRFTNFEVVQCPTRPITKRDRSFNVKTFKTVSLGSSKIGCRAGVLWRSGALTLPRWPGSQTRRHMWVEFVGSLLCSERFSPGTPVSPLFKNQYLT